MDIDVLGESEFDDDPDMALETVQHLIGGHLEQGVGTLLCSHGNVMATLLRAVGVAAHADDFDKGEFAIAQVDPATSHAVTVERHLP
jgi:hypothetical protein